MPYNIANDTEWVTSVRGISTSDQLEGGVGGVMNNTGLDLTKRTNWLKNELFKKPVLDYVTVNADTTITANDIGKAYIFSGMTGGTVRPTVSLPAIAGVQNGYGYYFLYEDDAADRVGRIAANGAEVIRIGRQQGQFAHCKPGRGGFWIVKDSTRWRLIGDNPLQDVGSVDAFARVTPPDGWVEAAGQVLTRAQYPDLFAFIGITFGSGLGDSLTFNVPDLRREFVRGHHASEGSPFGQKELASGVNGHIGTKPGTNSLALVTLNPDATETYSANERFGTTGGGLFDFTRYYVRPRNINLLYCIKF